MPALLDGLMSLKPCIEGRRDRMEIDPAFGHWFAGFTDGEGCFRIKPTNMGTYQCRFSIGLRADDAPILHEIRDALGGIGSLCHSGKDNIKQEQWRWEVNAKAHVLQLAEVFDRYPLRAKKAQDFAVWREAALLWAGVENGRKHDWTALGSLSRRLTEQRRYIGQPA